MAKPLSEAHIQATCTDWLALDGWRCVRTDMPHLRGLGVSEPGMADNLYLRYDDGKVHPKFGKSIHAVHLPEAAYSSVLWIEWKKRGGKTKTKQWDWHAKERSMGALTLIAGVDFPASIEGFCSWYAGSGLQLKRISIPR